MVPPLHLCYCSEAAAEEPRLAWFVRAPSADSALLGAVAGGDDKVVLTPSHGASSYLALFQQWRACVELAHVELNIFPSYVFQGH